MNAGTPTRETINRIFAITAKKPSGFILPVVLFTMLIVALIAATLESAVWQSARHARLGFAGERAVHAADAALAQTVANWNARAFASTPIGTRTTTTLALNPTLNASVTVVRTGATTALIEAIATSTKNGTQLNAQRRVTRALTLRTPPLPLTTALTALGTISGVSASTVTNIDDTPTAWNTECLGLTPIDAPTSPTLLNSLAISQFDANWNRWAAVASRTDDAATITSLGPMVTGPTCNAGTGEPLRSAPFIAACTNEWGARMLTTGTGGATLTGASRHQGILMVNGDLTLTGTLEIDGLLIVKGALDTTNGTLNAFGAVLVRDDLRHGSRLGTATRVRYSQCALRRALSAVGAPAAITSRGWLERF